MDKIKELTKNEWKAGIKKLGLDTHGKVAAAFGVSKSTAQRLLKGTAAVNRHRSKLMRLYLKHGIQKGLL